MYHKNINTNNHNNYDYYDTPYKIKSYFLIKNIFYDVS